MRQEISFIQKIFLHPATLKDMPFLECMLFEAFFWQPGSSRPDFEEFRQHPEFVKLLAGWGRPGDTGYIAEVNKEPVGAAWYRFWTDVNHSYGYIDAATPEIAIGVEPLYRGQGIGRKLLQALLVEAHRQGMRQVSLSVDPRNIARRLYESEGFVKVGELGTSWTMLHDLTRADKPR